MNWYLSKIVYQIICGDGNHTAQFDEQLRLIAAADEHEAFNKAKQIGMMEQESFLNDKNNLVKWKFINVCELYKLSELIDGAELYSRIQEADDADRFIEMIHHKADYIQGDNVLRSLQLI
jgi:phage anti-repressor protein